MSKLVGSADPRTGRIVRVYVQRHGAPGKLWFQKSGNGFRIRHDGKDAEFDVTSTVGEPGYLNEARRALEQVGLDVNSCSWADIVDKSRKPLFAAILEWICGNRTRKEERSSGTRRAANH